MGISDRIETFIMSLLKEENDGSWVEIKRNELASVFECVPSQINYVIHTRFCPELGYTVVSRRGGGGYIKIKYTGNEKNVSDILSSVGEKLTAAEAEKQIKELADSGITDKRITEIMRGAISDDSLNVSKEERDRLRANIFRHMLSAL